MARAAFFGGDLHLFGWYHSPHGNRRSTAGALLCPPTGHEYMCAHRALRNLAHTLADANIPTLRFDYHGMGNSGGSPAEPHVVAKWIDSIDAAADELRRRSGCERITLIGLRMGATLGAQVAATRTDIDTLVLWVPCADGSSFVREARLRAHAAPVESDHTVDAPDDGLYLSGFHFASSNIADLSSVTLRDIDAPHVHSTAFIARDGVGSDARLAGRLRERLQRTGSCWKEMNMSEYDTFMTAPLSSRLPTETLHQIAEWVIEKSRETEFVDLRAEVPERESTIVPETNARIVETPAMFGNDLFGVMTMPVTETDRAAILLNTGADHHVGPHRLYVELARTWALNGIAVLRFDLSGLGDSGSPSDDPAVDTYPLSAIADVTAAIEAMRARCNAANPVLIGVCAGGYHVIHALRKNNGGAIAVNAPLYWQRGDPVDVPPDTAIRSLRKWQRLFSRDRSLRETAERLQLAARHVIRRLLPRREPDLFPAGVPVALVYSDDDPGLRLFHQATGTTVELLAARRHEITVDIVAGAGHTFMGRYGQDVLKSLLTRRLFALLGVDPLES